MASNGQNLSYPGYARNKKGITLRIVKNEEGREVLADLVRHSDVVIHNFSPDTAKIMGLTYEELKALKSDIILTAISCFGSDGPYSNRQGFDFIAQAMSGSLALGGFADKSPIRAFMNPMDFGTALCATIGTLLALRHRDQTGEGQMVDLALLRTAISFNAPVIAEADVLGRLRPIIGNRAAYLGPTDLFRCKDGWVFIATIMDTLWCRLARAIGHGEFINDPDLQNDLQRFENCHKVDPLVAEWCAERTVTDVTKIMAEACIPCGAYLGLDEVSQDPHVQATGMIEYTDLEEPGLEHVPVSGIPMRLSKTPGRVRTRAPRVGEHNPEIYRDLQGYGEERIEKLAAEGVI